MSENKISDYIANGKKLLAVKLVQKAKGFSYKDASEYVDDIERLAKRSPLKPKQQRHYQAVSAIDGMEGHDFEFFCADLLESVGFSDVTVTPGSGDQGVDILAAKDGIKYAIQCKNYASALGNTPVQEVSAGKQFYGCHVGVVMTNSTFTAGAVQLAEATNILLWDRTKLDEMIAQAGGLSRFGLQPEFEEDAFVSSPPHFTYEEEQKAPSVNTPLPRKGMTIAKNICIGWSIICFLIFFLGVAFNEPTITMVGLGEGLFVLVFGIMFGIFANSEKSDPCIHLFGLHIKKPWFVFICFILAYILFFIAIFATGLSDSIIEQSLSQK